MHQDLIVACHQVDLDGVVGALRRGASINARFGEANIELFPSEFAGGGVPSGAHNFTPLLALAMAPRCPLDWQREANNGSVPDGDPSLQAAPLEKRQRVIWAIGAILVSHGCDLESKDGVGAAEGHTAVHLAVRSRHRRLAELLIRHGARVDFSSAWDGLPLHAAYWSVSLTELILSKGAKPQVKDAGGMNAADYARVWGVPEVREIYARLGIQPNFPELPARLPEADGLRPASMAEDLLPPDE